MGDGVNPGYELRDPEGAPRAGWRRAGIERAVLESNGRAKLPECGRPRDELLEIARRN